MTMELERMLETIWAMIEVASSAILAVVSVIAVIGLVWLLLYLVALTIHEVYGWLFGASAGDEPNDGVGISFSVDVDKADVCISPPGEGFISTNTPADDDPPGWPVDYTRSKTKPS